MSPPPERVSGERVSTSAGGFNPTWQRHVAAYGLCADLLPRGETLDLGCGVGHSYRLLSPRTTVGVDLDPGALTGQDRETLVADMRHLPFRAERFAGVLSVHSIEHVPDPGNALAEIRRVLDRSGVAVLVTPNRLTFGRPDEIIDPYHYVEFSPAELRAACEPFFAEVELRGITGSDRYMAFNALERRRLDRLLGADPLRLRRLVPRRARQRLYDSMLRRARAAPEPIAAEITDRDFALADSGLEEALDLVAVCSRPR